MTSYKLIYFAARGRAEAIRMAFAFGGIAFEDFRSGGPALFKARAEGTLKCPFGQFPVLEVDGQSLGQSGAMFSYVAKMAGLYPADAFQAARVDSVVDQISGEVASAFYSAYYGNSEEARPAALAELKEKKLAPLLAGIVAIKGSNTFIFGEEVTAADIVLNAVQGILAPSGIDITEVAPELKSAVEGVNKLEKLAAYFAQREATEAAEKAATAAAASSA